MRESVLASVPESILAFVPEANLVAAGLASNVLQQTGNATNGPRNLKDKNSFPLPLCGFSGER
jgi:hypothetical protein